MKRVIFIDDSPTFSFLIEKVLLALPIEKEILNFADPILFLNTYQPIEEDFLIIDIDLPKMNGIEVIYNLLTVSKGLKLKVVIFSSFLGNDIPLDKNFKNEFKFIRKPDFDELKKTLYTHFQIKSNEVKVFIELNNDEKKLINLICEDLSDEIICDLLCCSLSAFHKKKAILAKKVLIKNRPISFLRFALENQLYKL